RVSSWNQFLRMGTGTGYAASESAVPFVTNHDTERNSQAITYRAGEDYQLAMVLMVLHGYGSPMVYSGYSFSGRDDGPPQDSDGALVEATCIEGFEPGGPGEYVCAHTWPLVNAAVRFDAVAGEAELVEQYQDSSVLAVSRGEAFALVNRGDEGATVTVPTGLEPGDYCDLAVPDCGSVVTVAEDGSADISVGASSVAILTNLDRAAP
ncbi:MAG: alpha-amylase, partial [bacterium]|nr:alpha-amylase [bacterium]